MTPRPYERFAGVPIPLRVPVRGNSNLRNATRQRDALKKLSESEQLTGRTEEERAAFHAEQRSRVLRRYGMTA